MSYQGHQLEWRNSDQGGRMHLDGQPIHAGDALALRTRFGWVLGGVETGEGGRRMTFYFRVIEDDEKHEVYYQRASLRLSGVTTDGEVFINREFHLAWPSELRELRIRVV